MMYVAADGTGSGLHKPSAELPFHRAIYALCFDLGVIIHAHISVLVSFSILASLASWRFNYFALSEMIGDSAHSVG